MSATQKRYLAVSALAVLLVAALILSLSSRVARHGRSRRHAADPAGAETERGSAPPAHSRIPPPSKLDNSSPTESARREVHETISGVVRSVSKAAVAGALVRCRPLGHHEQAPDPEDDRFLQRTDGSGFFCFGNLPVAPAYELSAEKIPFGVADPAIVRHRSIATESGFGVDPDRVELILRQLRYERIALFDLGGRPVDASTAVIFRRTRDSVLFESFAPTPTSRRMLSRFGVPLEDLESNQILTVFGTQSASAVSNDDALACTLKLPGFEDLAFRATSHLLRDWGRTERIRVERLKGRVYRTYRIQFPDFSHLRTALGEDADVKLFVKHRKDGRVVSRVVARNRSTFAGDLEDGIIAIRESQAGDLPFAIRRSNSDPESLVIPEYPDYAAIRVKYSAPAGATIQDPARWVVYVGDPKRELMLWPRVLEPGLIVLGPIPSGTYTLHRRSLLEPPPAQISPANRFGPLKVKTGINDFTWE